MHAFYAEQAGGPFMTFSGWPTPDVRGLGFGAVGHPPLMLRPVGPIDTPAPNGFTLLPVTDAETAATYERVLITGYPVPELDPETQGSFLGPQLDGTPRWRHFIGLLDDEPVATGSGYVDEHHVHVEFIATLGDVPRPRCRLRDHRGRDARRAGSAGVADRERPRPTRVPTAGLHRDLAVHAVGRPSRRVLRWPARAAARRETRSATSSTPQSQPSTAPPVGGTTRRSPLW